jgi:hypothetical protein
MVLIPLLKQERISVARCSDVEIFAGLLEFVIYFRRLGFFSRGNISLLYHGLSNYDNQQKFALKQGFIGLFFAKNNITGV